MSDGDAMHLLRLARRVGTESDPKAVMSALLEEARRLNGATDGFVGRWDDEHQVITELHDSLADEGHVARQMALGEGATGRVALQRAPIILNDYQHLENVPSDVLIAGIQAALAAPLLHDGRLLGVVVCVRTIPRAVHRRRRRDAGDAQQRRGLDARRARAAPNRSPCDC